MADPTPSMHNITKVSDITTSDLADYLHIGTPTADETNTLSTLLTVAKAYIQQYTGRTAAEVDTFSDLVIVVFILVSDMYDNRAYYVDSSNVNRTVESILNLHAVNLL